MPQDRSVTPARLQSPGTAERQPSPDEILRRRATDAAMTRSRAAAAPPEKKGLVATIRERWAPVRKYSPARSPSKKK